ncbi:MAG: hypothetical protein U9R39_00830 [Campylobacterota bacterium]|nr:hypothetical protein [Campylobacterota bacterium]
MKVRKTLLNTGQPSATTPKKQISSELNDYLENYTNDNFRHNGQDKYETKGSGLLDHQNFFRFETSPDDYVSNIYNDMELIEEIKYMLNDYNSYDILESFEKLIEEDKINFGTHNDSSLGFLAYNRDDVENSEIFITTDRSLLGVVTTVVHEITHYTDLNGIANQTVQNTTGYDLDVNAFSRSYQFLKDKSFIDDKPYQDLSRLEKNIYELAYEVKNSKKENISQKNI